VSPKSDTQELESEINALIGVAGTQGQTAHIAAMNRIKEGVLRLADDRANAREITDQQLEKMHRYSLIIDNLQSFVAELHIILDGPGLAFDKIKAIKAAMGDG